MYTVVVVITMKASPAPAVINRPLKSGPRNSAAGKDKRFRATTATNATDDRDHVDDHDQRPRRRRTGGSAGVALSVRRRRARVREEEIDSTVVCIYA